MSRREEGERDADVNKLRKALARPRTMDQLTGKFNVDRRTIYRWMDVLTDAGAQIGRIGVGRPTLYRIV